MLGTAVLRQVDFRDSAAVQALLDTDPVANVPVASRVELGSDLWRFGGELWGFVEDGRLTALCYAGANLVPVAAGPPALAAFADRARRQGRRCASIAGPADQVLELWRLLEPAWGPARDVRDDQPLMATTRPADVAPDPRVRRVQPDELDVIMPACIAMFTEEVGVSPLLGDGGAGYRVRVRELVRQGRAFARIDDGQVLFKAEVGVVSRAACQLQGVWVHPDHRGEGLAAPGMAAVVRDCLADIAPVVSLYVNRYNDRAVRTYRRCGFDQVGTFATVLF